MRQKFCSFSTLGSTSLPKFATDGDQSGDNDLSDKSIPTRFSLRQNYPNPFNPETRIEYTLPKTAFVKLKVYNMLGQEVRTLVNEIQEAGLKSVVWDGKNNLGELVSSGVYVYRIVADEFTQSFKVVLMK